MTEPRRTTQPLAPSHAPASTPGEYRLHPSHALPSGGIDLGFDALAARLPTSGVVAVDGFVGIDWVGFREALDAALKRRGVRADWVDMAMALKPEAEIEAVVAPFLGGDDPIFGRRFTGSLRDFFRADRLAEILGSVEALGLRDAGLVIVHGCGSVLAVGDAFLVYVDLPKSELQFRARAGVATNLGLAKAVAPKPAYKRSYFVDWPVLNAHKKSIASRVDLVVDGQRGTEPAVVSGDDLRAGLAGLAVGGFRVRPWFEPGPWGGQWCKRRLMELAPAPNYAWSFELIVPENGLTFRDDGGRLIEVSFDWLMFCHGPQVLGESASWFGDEFPIRFDFLDTVEGGNLSVQVHPAPDYICRHFGERFTQDETYYILDAEPGAVVNLGFQDGVDHAEFRAALERSFAEASPLDAKRYVQVHPARRHDLFLIPHGTIHGAGVGNLILEISATPYIFTFKLYDWLRPDLDGKPRPLNISRGMENLDFSRSGPEVVSTLISRSRVVASGEGWTKEHVPTHAMHYYDVYRFRFRGEVEGLTGGSVHILSLVEGGEIDVGAGAGPVCRYHFAETFVISAAAGSYRLVHRGEGESVVVVACMKPRDAWPAWMGRD